jgi:DNA-binding GntR family transcriptional regulator
MEGTVPGVADTALGTAKTATPSKSQLAYDWIRERIDDGRYVSGFRLVLGQIARELDVSVVPVREAIRRLEAEGLVTFEKNVGAQVALLHDTEYTYTMQTLALVEGAATQLSAPLLTGDHLRRARAINRELIACLDDFIPNRFTQLNREFHAVLFEECPNPHILDLVHRGWNRLKVLRDSTFSFVPGRARESVEEHEQLLRLIEEHADPLEIELAARRHRLATLEAFLAYQSEHKHPQH